MKMDDGGLDFPIRTALRALQITAARTAVRVIYPPRNLIQVLHALSSRVCQTTKKQEPRENKLKAKSHLAPGDVRCHHTLERLSFPPFGSVV